jgi:hypothetical protein
MKKYKILAMGVILAFLFGNTAVMAVPAIKKPAGGAVSKVKAADGTITGITVTPANPGINKAIEVTVQGTITPGKQCSIIFLKGDGTPQSLVGHATSFPFKFGGEAYPLFVYSKAGTYTIKVYCGDGKCTGEAQAVVKVGLKMQSFPHDGAVPIKKPAGGAASPAKAAAGAMVITASKIEVTSLTAPVGKNIFLEARLISSKGELLGGKMIDFKVNGKAIGSAPTAAAGTSNAGTAKAPFHVSGDYPPGTYKIEAHFAGDATTGGGRGQGNLTVVKAQTKIELKLLDPAQISIGGDFSLDGYLKNFQTSEPISDRWVSIKVGKVIKKVVTDKHGWFTEGFTAPAVVTSGWESNVTYTFEAEFAGDTYYEPSKAPLTLKAIPQPPPVITSTHPARASGGGRILLTFIGTNLWPNGKNSNDVKKDKSAKFIVNDGSTVEECMITSWGNTQVSVECRTCYWRAPSAKVKAVVNGRESNIFEVPVDANATPVIKSVTPEKTKLGTDPNSSLFKLRLRVFPIQRMTNKFTSKIIFAGEEITERKVALDCGTCPEGFVEINVPDKYKTKPGHYPIQIFVDKIGSNTVYWDLERVINVNPAMKAMPKKLK